MQSILITIVVESSILLKDFNFARRKPASLMISNDFEFCKISKDNQSQTLVHSPILDFSILNDSWIAVGSIETLTWIEGRFYMHDSV